MPKAKVQKPAAKPPEKVIVACMRDEALFVVEWVAHHLAVGFDRIIVYTNDCSDGTDKLLDAMMGHLPVERYDNPGPYVAGTIQKQALAMAFELPQVRRAAWVMHIDADEYINVTMGQRRIDDLIALFPEVDAIALQWRHFGSAGKTVWDGGSVVETYTRCEAVPAVPGTDTQIGFKTLFRPHKFRMMGVHTPKLPLKKRVPVVVNAAGTPMPVDAFMTKRKSGYPVEAAQCSWQNACLHHHHVKSDDLHLLKHSRGDANGRKNTKRLIGSDFYNLANKNEAEDLSLVQFRPNVAPIEAQIRSLPGVMALEAAAMAWFRKRFHDMVEGPEQAEQEEAALEWLRGRMAEVRASAGPQGFERAAADWFQKLLIRLDEVDEDAADDGEDDDDENPASGPA